ncbi:MAG: hypothetical protein NTY98_05995 [Verrucomicrobia bacterium]|nr:hypothetical protein [Verrucomicrobiota bacterium]
MSWLGLLLALATVWVAVRWTHFGVLSGNGDKDLWSHEGDSWVWRQPLDVDLNEDEVGAVSAGAALEHYGSVRTLTLRRNTAAWLDAFFSQWRHRQSVEVLMVMYSEMNDAHLAGFAGADLKSAIFNNNLVSGEVFPPSPHLTYLEYNGTPVTDAGLRHLMRQCPHLERLCLYATGVTVAGVRASGVFKMPALKRLEIHGMQAPEVELRALKKNAAEANPALHLYLDLPDE